MLLRQSHRWLVIEARSLEPTWGRLRSDVAFRQGTGATRWSPARSDPGGERGSIIPLFAVVLFVMVAATMAVVAIAGHTARVARAQWAADAAALAVAAVGYEGGPQDGPGVQAGRLLAEANGAVLVRVSVSGSGSISVDPNSSHHGSTPLSATVVVEVEREGVVASAAAARFAAPPP